MTVRYLYIRLMKSKLVLINHTFVRFSILLKDLKSQPFVQINLSYKNAHNPWHPK